MFRCNGPSVAGIVGFPNKNSNKDQPLIFLAVRQAASIAADGGTVTTYSILVAPFTPPETARFGTFPPPPGWDRQRVPAGAANAAKDSEARISLHVAVRSANVRLFGERKATYLPTV